MNFLLGILIGFILGVLISYACVKYNNRQERKYKIEVFKVDYSSNSCFPVLYKGMTDIVFLNKLRKILKDSGFDEGSYKIKKLENSAIIIIKAKIDEIKKLLNELSKYEGEFYIVSLRQK